MGCSRAEARDIEIGTGAAEKPRYDAGLDAATAKIRGADLPGSMFLGKGWPVIHMLLLP